MHGAMQALKKRSLGIQQKPHHNDYHNFIGFWGLRENPFNVNPDPRYLFLTYRMQKALDELVQAVDARKNLILLTGEVGTGKTTLINFLLNSLHQQLTPTAFIFNSHLDISDLFNFILADFGIANDSTPEVSARVALDRWLRGRYRNIDTPVLIVDEAQGLPNQVLEEIRMLLNLEYSGRSLLRIVLAGQPELAVKLNGPELRQLRQRITVRCTTGPLTLEETHGYIQQRLKIAGVRNKQIFASEAVSAIYSYSHGTPRVVNLLCELALIRGYLNAIRLVPVRIVEEVARALQFDEFRPVVISLESKYSSGDVVPPTSIHAPAEIQPPSLSASEPASAVKLEANLEEKLEANAEVKTVRQEVVPEANREANPSLISEVTVGKEHNFIQHMPADSPSATVPITFSTDPPIPVKDEKILELLAWARDVLPREFRSLWGKTFDLWTVVRRKMLPRESSALDEKISKRMVWARNLIHRESGSLQMCRRLCASSVRWLRGPIRPVRIRRRRA